MTGAFMRKALLPMLASLALCGTATFAVIASNAHAQPEQKKPMMVALVTPAMAVNSVAPVESGGSARPSGHMHMPSPAEIAAHRKQMCQDGYAREAGALAYTEAKLSLSTTQQPLFEHWKQVKLDIAKRRATACASRERPRNAAMPSLLDRMVRKDLAGVTSADVLSDVAHRLMLLEAATMFGWNSATMFLSVKLPSAS